MKISLAQMNSKLGDFEYNSNKIINFCKQGSEQKADIVIFPELSLLGYSPNDLLERPELIQKQDKFLKKILNKIDPKLGAVVGCLIKENDRLFNGAVFIHNKKIIKTFKKTLLPSYDVFDETRHFTKGDLSKNFFKFKGKKILVAICEDLWGNNKKKYKSNPLETLKQSPDLILSINSSPFYKGKIKIREKLIKNISKKLNCSVHYVNQVGGQDEIIFDGQSFAVDHNQKKTVQLSAFQEELSSQEKSKKIKNLNKYEELENALILGVKDYFTKTGFKKAHLGLSGGIDSALVLYLASKALGAENVTGIAMPGPHSSKLSFDLAKKLSQNLSTHFEKWDINPSYKNFINEFEHTFGKQKFGLMNENLQARLRGLALMALSNREHSLLLATSNKSELCVGYSTLYGDQCGALMVIGDLLKTEVFELCKWINKKNGKEIIPKKIISRPPSAELRKNQKDSDSLPDYSKLDRSIENVITLKKKPRTDLDKWVLNRSFVSEFKRWQSAPILRVSEHAFGSGRRMPLAHGHKV